ncbi:GMC oxidoreductase [Thiocystis violacea]|uniref:GMC oxidoreductase n=1 Tax=Thiocystis violacea TaxID=13725 RepID=UPI00190810E2|nr:GMC family oxidoreductase [Thiocystis violacea]MBK1724579.1 choline dehydrogenase [Thiocystis violacea]
MPERFDVIVIGTGFGGAITACRLAQAGARVLILERGRRWTPETYPRRPGDPWLYWHDHPDKHHGWLDVRLFRGMAVAQGAGVGGGSLCYSSVVMEADPERFAEGWPPEITYEALKPYYDTLGAMLGVQPIPERQRTRRYELLRGAAEKLGYADRVESVPLAIAFDPDYHYDLPDPIDAKHSKSFVNAQGVRQGTCVHLGNCDIGCDVQAKNTLDLNYIPAAEASGAELRALHKVRYVAPIGQGYEVFWDVVGEGRLRPGSAQADRVVVAAGSLGSTEILLRSRDQYGALPGISRRLGSGWSGNANFLTPATYPEQVAVEQGIGPTISAGLNFMDGKIQGQRFYVEDDGFPNLLLNALGVDFGGRTGRLAKALRTHLARGLDEKNPARQVMVWLGEGLDAADGRLKLRRRFPQLWKRELDLDWDVSRTKPVIEAILDMHRRLTEAGGGRLHVPPYWQLLRGLITVHPLGGCPLGEDIETGVVDHRGQVFNYPNLYVADGAILPRPTGRNPSMTIGALAERVADLMVSGEAG